MFRANLLHGFADWDASKKQRVNEGKTMGRHAFEAEPQHCRIYREIRAVDDVPQIYGVDERWNMPAVRHKASLGQGTRFEGVGHYVLTYHINGAHARRLDLNDGLAIASPGALSLQRPDSSGVFASSGVVDYAHFYFNQGLLCEIAEELEGAEMAEPSDFFALFDAAASNDAAAYVQRAATCEDPPTSIEMDSRAYLLGLGILRAVRNRTGHMTELSKVKPGCAMRPVLEHIEDRIGEVLRLNDLARTIDMSPFHFTRVFKAELGLSPSKYLAKRRVERARDLIRQTSLPLAEIAFRTGFSSQAHMTSRMKAEIGATPGELRKN